MAGVTLIRPLNKGQSALAVVTCVLHKTRQLVVPRTIDKIWRSKLCRPRTSYLEQSTCWAASSRRVPRYLMANVTQWLNDLDTISKQTSRSFVLVPIDFSYMTPTTDDDERNTIL